jgi:hypothetical protein
MSTKAAKTVRLVGAPKIGATNGVGWKIQLPVWISSVVMHGGLLGAFYAVIVLFGLFDRIHGQGLKTPTQAEQPVVTKVDEAEPDTTNTEVGGVTELPTAYNISRKDDVAVPGPINSGEDVGIPDAPEGPKQTLPAPPGSGIGSGQGVASLEPGSGGIVGTQGGYSSGLLMAGGFGGRSGATRDQLLVEGGGNSLSEAAVARGLEWLAKHQAPDGHWSMNHFHQHGRVAPWPAGEPIGDCGCTGPSGAGNDVAGTAFGLLPFLGAGVTHKPITDKRYQHDYSKNVEAGLNFLKKKQTKEGDFTGGMYSHGLATIAVCEAYGLTGDMSLKPYAQKAINYIVEAQDVKGSGGWRYSPKSSGDMSVSGWQLMALKSGQMSGLSVPKKTMDKAEEFWKASEVRGEMDPAAAEGSLSSKKKPPLIGFSYTPAGKRGGTATTTMTAVGLLGNLYMGTTPASRDMMDAIEGTFPANNATAIMKNPPGRTNNTYYEYYATQVMHHMGGDYWRFWNLGPDGTGKGGIRDTLIAKQDKGLDPKHAHQAGSWDGSHGRLMTTSLSLLELEVYYRHLPLYRRELSTVKEEK